MVFGFTEASLFEMAYWARWCHLDLLFPSSFILSYFLFLLRPEKDLNFVMFWCSNVSHCDYALWLSWQFAPLVWEHKRKKESNFWSVPWFLWFILIEVFQLLKLVDFVAIIALIISNVKHVEEWCLPVLILVFLSIVSLSCVIWLMAQPHLCFCFSMAFDKGQDIFMLSCCIISCRSFKIMLMKQTILCIFHFLYD